MNHRIILSALISMVLISSSILAEPERWGEVTEEEWSVSPPPGYSSEPALVVFDNGYAKWEAKHLRFSRHLRIKLLDSIGIESASTMTVEMADYDHLDKFKAQVLKADGSRTELHEDSISEEEHDGLKIFRARLSGAQPGDIIEWFYKIEYYGGFDYLGPMKLLFYAMRFGDMTSDLARALETLESRGLDRDLEQYLRNIPTWYFDNQFYTLRSQLKVDLMTKVNYAYYPANFPVEGTEPEVEEHWLSGYKYYTWSLENIPAYSGMAGNVRRADRVAIYFNMLTSGHGATIERKDYTNEYWGRIGLGLRAYLSQYCDRTGGADNRANKLVDGIQGDRARVDTIFAYVTRKFSSECPLVALRPQNWNVSNFYDDKSGAAFEANVLLREMLTEVGIDASPVFINTAGNASFRETGDFDHMIVLVNLDGEALFLDACLSACGAGQLPSFSEAEEGLMVTEESLGFLTIVSDQCPANVQYLDPSVP